MVGAREVGARRATTTTTRTTQQGGRTHEQYRAGGAPSWLGHATRSTITWLGKGSGLPQNANFI